MIYPSEGMRSGSAAAKAWRCAREFHAEMKLRIKSLPIRVRQRFLRHLPRGRARRLGFSETRLVSRKRDWDRPKRGARSRRLL